LRPCARVALIPVCRLGLPASENVEVTGDVDCPPLEMVTSGSDKWAFRSAYRGRRARLAGLFRMREPQQFRGARLGITRGQSIDGSEPVRNEQIGRVPNVLGRSGRIVGERLTEGNFP